jgi:branched-chain amino acid transport system substrate-binding protein
MRKWSIGAVIAVMASVSLAACGSASTSGDADGGAADAPIKIALIPPTSGALAQFGADAVKAWKLAAKEANEKGGVAGHPVEIIEKATDADPATTLRVAREAVTQDGARFIGAVMTSPEHAALNAQLASLGALSFNALGKDDALVAEQCVPYSFAIVQRSMMDINALAEALGELPGDRWAIQAVDYATGHSAAEKFRAAAAAVGKEIVLEQFAPLNTSDFGSYITKILESGADAVFAVEYGADGVAFVKQAEQFGLTDRLQTVLGFNMVSEPLFETLGDTIVGFYNNVGYDIDADNPLNTAFVESYTKEYGTPPYYVPADNYLAAQTLFAGIEAAGSIEPSAVAEALNDLAFDSIVGRVTMRGADHQLLRPSYLGRVVKADTGLKFEIIVAVGADKTTPTPSPACKM